MSKNEYDKKSIIAILMRRDGIEREDAEEIVEECQEQVNAAFEEGDCGTEEIYDIIQDYLGLEPDYADCFIPF